MDALPQNWKPYRPLIPAAALLAAGGWLLFGSGGELPFTSEVIGSECRRLEVLRKNILELREQNRQLEAEIREKRRPPPKSCASRSNGSRRLPEQRSVPCARSSICRRRKSGISAF